MADYEKEKDKKVDDSRFKSLVHDSHVLTWFIRSNVDEFKDSYDWGFTEGKAEGILESASNVVVSLVKNEGWTLEKAMSVTGIPDELKGRLEEEVGKRLN